MNEKKVPALLSLEKYSYVSHDGYHWGKEINVLAVGKIIKVCDDIYLRCQALQPFL